MPVAEATFVMAGPLGFAGADVKAIEAGMLAALEKAQAEGVTDTDEIRRRILAALDEVA